MAAAGRGRRDTLFDGVGEPDRSCTLLPGSFALVARPCRTLRNPRDDRKTSKRSASRPRPMMRPCPALLPRASWTKKTARSFAPSIMLAEQAGARRGMVAIRGWRVWRAVRLMAASSILQRNAARSSARECRPVPSWGDSTAVNIPALSYSENATVKSRNRTGCGRGPFKSEVVRPPDGIIKLTVDIVSVDGPHEFILILR